jgi:hypothetical protein
MDLTIYFEKVVRNFSRYHKYTLGTELRAKSREIVGLIIKANSTVERYKSERKWINTVYHELGHYVFGRMPKARRTILLFGWCGG